MASIENPSREHRHLPTWPFRRRAAMRTESFNSKIEPKVIHEIGSERDLTHQYVSNSIFMTNSSKSLQMIQENIFNNDPASIYTRTDLPVTYEKRDNEIEDTLLECPICCNSVPINESKEMLCCSVKLCLLCFVNYLMTNIHQSQSKIKCPTCTKEIDSSTILYNDQLPVSVREHYQRILAENLAEKQDTCVKLCPHCNFITIIDENNSRKLGKKSRRSRTEWIHCEQCQKSWCWSCYSPTHPDESCQQYQKHHTQLDAWAKARRVENKNQRNAQRCPKCSIYIEKIDGCDHMLCTKCNSKFCYRCGCRIRLPFFIGHDAKYSVFGCKYKLCPDRPIIRWLIRGSVLTGVIVLTPIVLGALISLVAIGIPTVLLISCFGLPVLLCLECKKRR